MDSLDAAVQSPADYEGKAVVVGGCRYEVGPLVDSGPSKFVHALRNAESGLVLNVLTVFPDGGHDPDGLRREIEAETLGAALGAGQVPNIMAASVPGAVAFLKEHEGPYETEPSHAVSAGDRFVGDGQWDEALVAYDAVLDVRPAHTVALSGSALALARSGRVVEAVHRVQRALSVEPNYLPYLRAFVEYAHAAGMPREVLLGHRAVREKYPYDKSCDGLAADALDVVPVLLDRALDRAAEVEPAEALAMIGYLVDIFRLLADAGPEEDGAASAESLLDLGSVAGRVDPAAGVEPYLQAMALARSGGRADLADRAFDALRGLVGDAGAAAEFERLTGESAARLAD